MSKFLVEGTIRGRDTKTGEAGYCENCQHHMPEGVDICLGIIPGVSHACCGHGIGQSPYVVIGGLPDQSTLDIKDKKTLYGEEALVWLRNNRVSTIGEF